MSTDLAVLDNNNLVPFDDGFGEEQQAIKPSPLVLVQGMTRDAGSARPGQIYDKRSGKVYDSITLVLLNRRYKRTMFPPGAENVGSSPICKSYDAKVPSQYVEHPQAPTCARCPNSRFNGNTPPACKLQIQMLTIVKDTTLPRTVTFSGTGIKPTEEMLTSIREDILANRANGMNLAIYDYYFELSLEKKPTKKGVVYVPKFDVKRVPNASAFGPFYEQYVVNARSSQSELEEDEQSAASDTVIDATVVEV